MAETPTPSLTELLLRDILRAKAHLEAEKFTPLQDYFTAAADETLMAKVVGIQMPQVTEDGIVNQIQWMPLYMLCPCRFFKLENLSLELDAYLEADDPAKPRSECKLTLNKKNGWFSVNRPVRLSVHFNEQDGIRIITQDPISRSKCK
ncbi:hypothetical protein [Celerinatantimonas sp. YJH-8]|uniref:hypothetical protein n=1 Tax=Celerinatantimonas sp. YJH-8 TaxID=3228714 RepID=UPI0038C54A07